MDKKTELAISLGQAIYTNTINSLTEQRDELADALRELMEWQIKNVQAYSNPPYDRAHRLLERLSKVQVS